jgi:hypothetical protein
MTFKEDAQLDSCKNQIEQMLQWGNSQSWTDREFDELSEEIFAKTSVKLSVTTLKRLWRKVHYEGAFNITTLNALARFLGFKHWRDMGDKSLTITASDNLDNESKSRKGAALPGWSINKRKFMIWSAAAVILFLIIYFIPGKNRSPEPDKAPNFIYP